MAETKTWILLCDASRARLFTTNGHGSFTEMTAYAHPGSRAHVQDMVSDRPGRRSDNGPGSRSGVSPELEPKEVEALKFACSLATELKRGLNRHAYDELVLAAPPHFLGLVRQCLDSQVANRVVATFDKDFTTLPAREIEQRVYAFKR